MAQTKIVHPLAVTNAAAGGVSVFLMGYPGSWKTTWMCQWPGVAIISFANEQGDHAITNYPDVAQWFLTNAKTKDPPPVFNWEMPQFFRVRSVDQFDQVIDEICAKHKQWKISTVGIDLIQYYIAMWQQEYFTLKYKDRKWAKRAEEQGGEAMDQQSWGFLNNHLDGARVRLYSEGLNTIWSCHTKEIWEPREDKPQMTQLKAILPHIQGGTRISLPGATSLHIAAEAVRTSHPTAIGRDYIYPRYWTLPDRWSNQRHKYFMHFPQGKLVDPDFGDVPTFRALWMEIGKYVYICR